MGKPFQSELKALSTTFQWAREIDIGPLSAALSSCKSLPMSMVGSGGSLTTAYFAAYLHQLYYQQLSKAVTPLDLVSGLPTLRNTGVFFLSASGKNPDIIGGFNRAIIAEPPKCLVLCTAIDSLLARSARDYEYVELFEYPLPSGKDGFLATNTLLASIMLLIRAYSSTTSNDLLQDIELPALLNPFSDTRLLEEQLRTNADCIWDKETIVILYGPDTMATALDLESKFAEAALGNIQIADYRNFAHGRHHWLAKRPQSTAVIALVTGNDRTIAIKTLNFIPDTIPVLTIETALKGPLASVFSLIASLFLVGIAGSARGIDPGRPGVPEFGRRIYNFRGLELWPTNRTLLPDNEAIAIERKTRESIETLHDKGVLDFWRSAYRSFTKKLEAQPIGAVVLDYDGTLCDRSERFSGIGDRVAEKLSNLLQEGVVIGVATGRGRSCREDLRHKLDRRYWKHILMGYYNGADLGYLDDDAFPRLTSELNPEIEGIDTLIRESLGHNNSAVVTTRHSQVTVECTSVLMSDAIWNALQHLINMHSRDKVHVLRSSHSIDICLNTVSKLNVVLRIKQQIRENQQVLCIGDKGAWPGNDSLLLSSPVSLSVDEVSYDPSTCWNLSPQGVKGVQSTLYYLNLLHSVGSGMQIKQNAKRR